jgi:NADH pyrophosphatase NudC (nudix superfamily)
MRTSFHVARERLGMVNITDMHTQNNAKKYCSRCGKVLNATLIDGAERYVCSTEGCGFIDWNNPVPVVAALVKFKDRYILARNVTWPKGVFSVITGYLESGESPQEAVVREVAEELGLSGKVTRHIGNYAFKEKNQIILCYEVEASGDIVTNHELAEIKALTAKELSAYDFSPLYITENIKNDWSVMHTENAY